jgi:HD-GYP domain-containing protein (c-di-GMP phosphodiesterase class II)
MSEAVETLSTLLVTTATRVRLYGRDHPVTRRAMNDFLSLHKGMTDGGAPLRFYISGEEIFFNEQVLPQSLGGIASLARRLSSKGIGFLELKPGLGPDELLDFCGDLVEPGGAVKSHSNIQLGDVKYISKGAGPVGGDLEAARILEPAGTLEEGVSAETRELDLLYQHVKEHLEVRVQNFEALVLSFLSRFARQFNPLVNLAELQRHHKYTSLHATNVANLSIGLGLGLGLDKKDIFDIGLAALLHDTGKNFVPKKILEKPGQLTAQEWDVVRQHPAEGARFLLKQKRVNRLSVVVAFEHHLHYHGGGGYPKCKPPRRPCLASQLVSIADTFDALFSSRSYHRKYDIMSAIEIITDCSGFNYNPWLVDVFSRYITMNLESVEDKMFKQA